jgi:UDP-N-acetylmuramyl pentapeptide phosphotransferase/UDP-N-acetylglucosamine-1-phosphate transferase
MASFLTLTSAVLAAFVVSALLTRRFCNPSSRWHVLDHPNERSLHTRPTPRTGGVAIFGSLIVAFAWWLPWTGTMPLLYGLGAGAGLVAVLSFLDDRTGLPVRIRLAGHVVAAVLVVGGGIYLPEISVPGLVSQMPGWFGKAFSLLFLIWMINLYNFMDGMDGLAGGMAVFGFGTFALLGLMAGNPVFLGINLVIAAAAGGFLLFNFPPARIFMGDTGSASLGLLAGGASLWGAQDGVFPFWVALLVFSPFIIDATVTLLRRLFNGEAVWEAHRKHFYQRLVQSGWGHRKTAFYEYGLMAACGGSALLGRQLGESGQVVLIVIWCCAYLILMGIVDRLERRKLQT